jgi:predicted nuclease with TOPRIM domain
MASSSDVQTKTKNEELRSSNFRLNSIVQELRLEISFYQGETKRLEWEKNILKQDVGKMSALFKGWLHELQTSNERSVVKDAEFFSNLVRHPSKNISEILQSSNLKSVLTTCHFPFFIEVRSDCSFTVDALFVL